MINHGVPEELMKAVMDGSLRFFYLSEEEKHEYQGKHVLDPIRCGTSFNASVDKVLFWRDFLKVFVYPEFHFPDKPAGFRYIYCFMITFFQFLFNYLCRNLYHKLVFFLIFLAPRQFSIFIFY